MSSSIAILSLFIGIASAALLTPIPGMEVLPTVPLEFKSRDYPGAYPFPTITGTLVDGLNPLLIPGNIVLAARVNGQLDTNLYLWQAGLPKAVILLSQGLGDQGIDVNLLDCWECVPDFQLVPFVSINPLIALELYKLLNNTVIPGVTVTFDEPNPYEDLYNSGLWRAGQVIIEVMSGVTFALSVWKLAEFRKAVGFRLSVSQVSLVILTISSVLSIINWVDPYSTSRIYPYSFWVSFMLCPLPLVDAVILLVILYWHELITLEAIRVSSFIGKLAIPFFVFSIGLIILDYIAAIFRSANSTGLTFQMLFAQALILLVVDTVMAIFYLITSIRVVLKLKESTGDLKRVKKTSTFLGISGVGLVIRVGSVIAAVTDPALPMKLFYSTVFVGQFATWMIAISIALSFNVQNKKYKTYLTSTKSGTEMSQSAN